MHRVFLHILFRKPNPPFFKMKQYVIQHPARVDLFCNGEGQYVPLDRAKKYDSPKASDIMGGGLQPGEKMIPVPAKQPVHPISK